MEILGRELTTIRIGGPIQRFEQPATADKLRQVLGEAKDSSKVIGGGSNLIFSDSGFRGMIIQPLLLTIEQIKSEDYSTELASWKKRAVVGGRFEGEDVYQNHSNDNGNELVLLMVGSGVHWAKLLSYCLQNQLAGLEIYARIPCRVGGAVRNNIHAGAELLGDHIVGVEAISTAGVTTFYSHDELGFGYDLSRFIAHPEAISRVLFALKRVDFEQAQKNTQRYRSIIELKTGKQPSGANCGSVFKNIEATGGQPVAAAWYIEQSGCKGREVGALQVSPIHANFITNRGGGNQEQFLELVASIKKSVFTQFGFNLELEVEVIDERGAIIWT